MCLSCHTVFLALWGAGNLGYGTPVARRDCVLASVPLLLRDSRRRFSVHLKYLLGCKDSSPASSELIGALLDKQLCHSPLQPAIRNQAVWLCVASIALLC